MLPPSRALSALGRRLETGRIVLYGLGVGLLAGAAGTLGAYLLEGAQSLLLQGISGYHPPGLPAEGGLLHAFPGETRWLLPALLAIALALAVLLERFLGPAQGDPLDAAIGAYHNGRARLAPREVTARGLASLVALGAGVPFGREGPFAVLGAGLGALFGRLGRLSEEDRRLVFVAGLAAGLGLALRAPLAGAVLAVELLYRRFEFEFEALTPAVLASVVAYAVYGLFRGFGPLLEAPQLAGQPPALLPAFFLLGLLEAAAAAGLVAAVRALRAAWLGGRVPAWLRLALAGGVIGLVGALEPGVLGDGLGWSQLSLSGFLPVGGLAVLLVGRALATLVIAPVGGAGSLVGPSLVLGGLVGGLYAAGLGWLFPGVAFEPAAFVLTGMAAFLAGAVNAPLAATLLVTEWSGYTLLVPLLLTTAAGYALTGRESLLRFQAESRSASQAHIAEYLRDAARLAGPPPEPAVTAPAGAPDLLDLLAAEPLSVSDRDRERLYRTPVPAPWIGQAVRDLEWPADTLLVAILREGHIRVPRGETVLELGDDLVVIAEPEGYSRFAEPAPEDAPATEPLEYERDGVRSA